VLVLEDADFGGTQASRVTWINPIAVEFLGWDAAEFSRQAPGVALVAPSGDLARLLSELRICHGPVLLARRSGELVDATATVIPLMGVVGRPAWGVIVRPIEEQSRARVERHAEQRLTALFCSQSAARPSVRVWKLQAGFYVDTEPEAEWDRRVVN